MSNPKSKPPEAGKRTGFYAAIYGCAGLMLTLAVVIGYRNLAGKPQAEALAQAPPEVAAVTKDTAQSYLTPTDRAGATAPTVPPKATAAPAATPRPTATPKAPSTQATAAPTAPPGQTAPSGTSELSEPPTDDGLNYADSVTGEHTPYDDLVLQGASTAFTAYDGNEGMAWPVVGDVVMEYSVDHVVYDKTLDQYRVNDTLCIAAETGETVRAAADGIVAKITTTKEKGKTVLIDNGNGWFTTYSQLQDGVLVKVGDVVSRGQVIGGVGSPSIYSILLGSHLGFAVSKDEETVNPMDVLAFR